MVPFSKFDCDKGTIEKTAINHIEVEGVMSEIDAPDSLECRVLCFPSIDARKDSVHRRGETEFICSH